MKYNEKQFYQVKTEPIEVQELEKGRKVELYYMNEQPFFNENINKRRFSTWATANGNDYRLFVEQGYYETGKELYSAKINQQWMNFWDRAAQIRKRYVLFILLPGLVIFCGLMALFSILFPDKTWILLLCLGVALVGSLFASSFLSRKLEYENYNTALQIREEIGKERFDEILQSQEKYTEDFYQKLNEEYDRLEREEQERLAREQADETTKIETIDGKTEEQEDEVAEIETIDEETEEVNENK